MPQGAKAGRYPLPPCPVRPRLLVACRSIAHAGSSWAGRMAMLSFQVTWREAAIASLCALVVAALAAVASRRAAGARWGRVAKIAWEAGMLLGLYALWQFAGSLSDASRLGAVRRAEWIWHFERAIALPSETAIQRVFLPHPLLVQGLNLYYAVLHFPVLIGCLIWLFIGHRGRYWQLRTTVVLFTAGALLIQLIPVAPPRLLPGDGMIDTALHYGQSVYGPNTGIDTDQMSAMPSVHVGWALLVAAAVVTTVRSRWRWLVLAYPALTALAVTVTANHFWLDGIAAAALLALVLLAQGAARAARPALATRFAQATRLARATRLALVTRRPWATPLTGQGRVVLPPEPATPPPEPAALPPGPAGRQLVRAGRAAPVPEPSSQAEPAGHAAPQPRPTAAWAGPGTPGRRPAGAGKAPHGAGTVSPPAGSRRGTGARTAASRPATAVTRARASRDCPGHTPSSGPSGRAGRSREQGGR